MKEVFESLAGNAPLKASMSAALLSEPPSISHAYIIEGATPKIRKAFALQLAEALVCGSRGSSTLPLPCGCCRNCRNIAAGIAPDVQVIAPDEGKASLGVDKIRDLRNDIHIYPTEFDYKIYIIDAADSMTVQAQNAFLLTLEEPPAYAVLLLLCEDGRSLLETVRSRAPMLRLEPAEEDGDDADDEAGIKKDAAEFASLCSDPSRGSAAMSLLTGSCKNSRETAMLILKQLSFAFRDLLMLKKAPGAELLFFTERETARELASKYPVTRLIGILEAVGNAAASLEKNMNTRLTLMKMLTDARII